MKPLVHNLDGHRNFFSLAADWRITPDTLFEAEFEYSHKVQPSQNGFSLLGNRLPPPANPRLNLNNQPWSQPSVFDALTGTLRFTQALNADWRWSAQLGTQRLKSDDRLAYAFGCSAEDVFDRYCSDGTFRLLRLPQRERTAPSRRRADRPQGQRDDGQRAARARLRPAAVAHAQSLRERCLQLRGHGQCLGHGRGTARPRAAVCPDRPRRTLDRALGAGRDPLERPLHHMGRPAPHATRPAQHRQRRQRSDRLPPEPEHALGRGQLCDPAGPDGLCELGQGRGVASRSEQARPVHQRRPGAAPAGPRANGRSASRAGRMRWAGRWPTSTSSAR